MHTFALNSYYLLLFWKQNKTTKQTEQLSSL